MVSPPGKDEKEEYLQRRLGEWAVNTLGGGVTGKESISTIDQRAKQVRLTGRDKLIIKLGSRTVERIEANARSKLRKTYAGLKSRREMSVEEIVKRAEKGKSLLLFRRKGFGRFREVSNRLVWRTPDGRYSKPPPRSRKRTGER